MKRLIHSLVVLATAILLAAQMAWSGTFEASASAGILDVDNATYLLGDVFQGHGDLVQLIWAGPDGVADLADSLGQTTDDDSLLGTTYIGYGYPFEPNSGKFSTIWTHDALVVGAVDFIRAWNDSVVSVNRPVAYGNSELYTLANDFDSHDFQSFRLSQTINVPVELSSFVASAKPGMIEVRWTTQSETDNLGFYVYRSESPHGVKTQLNDKLIEGAMNSQIRHDYLYEDREIVDQMVYYYWLADVALDGRVTFNGPRTAVAMSKPEYYSLEQNYPNPFNPSTSIRYQIKESGWVNLTIYNIRGQMIRRLVNQAETAGDYNIEWDGRDESGLIVPSGTYIYSLDVNGFRAYRRMTMTK